MSVYRGTIASVPFKGPKGMGMKINIPDLKETFACWVDKELVPTDTNGYLYGSGVEIAVSRMYASGRDIRLNITSIKLVK